MKNLLVTDSVQITGVLALHLYLEKGSKINREYAYSLPEVPRRSGITFKDQFGT